MPVHETPLISLLAIGLTLAFFLGAAAVRLRLSPIVGYLLAGVVVGPFTPGYVADAKLATELAEIGVILLMFGVGLHFSFKDLLSVRAIAIPGALAQIATATLLGLGLALLLGWGVEAGLVFGLALSVASTVVLLRALQERHLVQTERGRIAVGWLVVEDLVMVIALVLLPTWASLRGDILSGESMSVDRLKEIGLALGLTLSKVVAFVALMLIVGKRTIPWILHMTAHTGSRELFRLAVLAIALGVALGASALFGVSFALGAFFAGMIMAESELSQQAMNETLPLRDAFAVLFFVSVGMLFNPMHLLEDPWPILAALAIVVVGKSLAALAIMALFRQPASSSGMIAASLAQIGEFSFILAGLGIALDLLPEEARDLVLAAALLSILLNPAVFRLAGRLAPQALRAAETSPAEPRPVRRALIIGYGRVGRRVLSALNGAGVDCCVIDDSEERVAAASDCAARVLGNAVLPETLEAAGAGLADMAFVTVPDAFEASRIVELLKAEKSGIKVYVRSYTDAEAERLKAFEPDEIFSGEKEIADAMIRAALGAAAAHPAIARA
jgi:CPA2 family monovalent cation:H+ antiporter-2